MSLDLEAEARRLTEVSFYCHELIHDHEGACPFEAEILTLLQKVAHENWLRGRAEGAAAEHTAWLLDHENYAKRAEQEGWLRGMGEVREDAEYLRSDLKRLYLDVEETEETHPRLFAYEILGSLVERIDAAIAKGEGTK